MKENNFIGRPYKYHDWIGEVTQFVTSGGFKGCYEVRVTNIKTKETCHWWFQKHILEAKYK